jgi:hypothetical protein
MNNSSKDTRGGAAKVGGPGDVDLRCAPAHRTRAQRSAVIRCPTLRPPMRASAAK